MVLIPSWPTDVELPVDLIKPLRDPDIGMWCPVMEISWGIGILPLGSTLWLQLAIGIAELLPNGAIRYDTGVRDFGTRLQVDVNWRYSGNPEVLTPDWKLHATLNKSLRLPVLEYHYTDGDFFMTGEAPPSRDRDFLIVLEGIGIPACVELPNVNVLLKARNPVPPLPTNEGYLLSDKCE